MAVVAIAILTVAPLPRAWAAWSCRSMPYSLHLGGAILQAYTYYAVLAMLFLLTTYLLTTTYCHSAVARPTHYLATYHPPTYSPAGAIAHRGEARGGGHARTLGEVSHRQAGLRLGLPG